ncbi:MAG TPA: fumarate hydratase [Methanobacterium sp.]|jgi:fumarate hydratase subunit alpha|nr:MAG: fumarate hydratase [Methanobacterium sp.]HOI71758.1 fumarate hydratase [Methanobacterium sp.]HPX77817.1 fumarate hydratase [Methanobacterium sp.]
MITQKQVEDVICNLFKQAVINLSSDVVKALDEAYKREEQDIARTNLEAILKNINAAHELEIPMCQDTGLTIVFVKLGKVEVENLYEGIRKGVEKATKEIPLRPNVVDPLTRINTGNNVGKLIPQIDLELVDGEYIEFTVFPKGFGSENNNALMMGLPGDGVEGIKKFVVDTVIKAGGKPCPPIVVGIGIGGSSDMSMKLAKKALLRDVGVFHHEERISTLEKEILKLINDTGIGPMGLGGKTTALDVKIEYADTHTAGLPVGVCIQCWADRHASAVLKP